MSPEQYERLLGSREAAEVLSISWHALARYATMGTIACGYIIKSVDPRDLGSAIRQAVEGTAFHALGLPAITEDTVAKAAGLTEREFEIMKAVARGLANKAIGKELWITEQTVKFHLTNIYRKLGISNRTEAARWALSRGLEEQQFQHAS